MIVCFGVLKKIFVFARGARRGTLNTAMLIFLLVAVLPSLSFGALDATLTLCFLRDGPNITLIFGVLLRPQPGVTVFLRSTNAEN